MKPMNLSANALAHRLGVTTTRFKEIVNERCGITADTALRLARCFSTTPEFWMSLQQRYELEAACCTPGSRFSGGTQGCGTRLGRIEHP